MLAGAGGLGVVPNWNHDGTRNGTGFFSEINDLTGRFRRFHSLAHTRDTITHTRVYVRPIPMEPMEPVEPVEYLFDIARFLGSVSGSIDWSGWNRPGADVAKPLKTNKIWGGYRGSAARRADKGLFGRGARRKFRQGGGELGRLAGAARGRDQAASGQIENGGNPPFSGVPIAHVGRAMLEGSAQGVDPAAFSGPRRQSARLSAAGADRGGGGAAGGRSPLRAPPSPLLLTHEIFRISDRRPIPPSVSALGRAPFLAVTGWGRGCGKLVRCPTGRGEARSLEQRNRGRGHGKGAKRAEVATLGRGWGHVN